MHLLRAIERALFYGDSNLSSLQYDGFIRQILDNSPATNIYDCKNQPLTEDNLNDSAMVVNTEPNYGLMNFLYLNPKSHSDLVKSFFPKSRYDLMEKKDGMVGLDIRGWTSPSGNVMFEPDTFITPGRASGGTGTPLTNGLGDVSKRPSVPTISVAAAAGGAGSDFDTGDAGAYRYKVVAANRYGKSIPVVVTGSPVTVTAGQEVTFTVTEGAIPTGWWEVSRSLVGGAANSEKLILRVPRTGGTQVLTDTNYWRPGTTIAIGFQLNLEAVSFKQLAPMIKIPLATVDTAIRWMQLIYGTPILYTPGKIFLFRNIGRDPGSVGIAA